MLKKIFISLIACFSFCYCSYAAQTVIEVKASGATDNKAIAEALEKAASFKGKPVTLKLFPGIYNFGYKEAIQEKYHVSNTTSEEDSPDALKHIAVLLKGLKNLTIDGGGATWLMKGEMTSFIIDNCENLTLKNINIDYEHPTLTELEVVRSGADYIVAKVHPTSQYRIEDGKLIWYGEGWEFDKGLAQTYDRVRDMTWRSWGPMRGLKKTIELRPNLLYMQYDSKPEIAPNTIYQMRDGIRDEVCGCVTRSRNIRLENINYYYLGNFGVVCQCSESITFDHSNFMPKPGSGRTNAGFADFIQVSGCKGLITITNSNFSGAHDDPINIHGTHLQIVEYIDARTVKVRYMHPQTHGFQSFFAKDEIELVDTKTLLPLLKARVAKAELVNPHEIVVSLDKAIPESIQKKEKVVMENITYTPDVLIKGNTFSRIPTRGILLTTRGKSVIEDNIFYGMRMSAILVSDDANKWFESGPVHQLTIRRNTFIECNSPIIKIVPEYREFGGPVHKNISIVENTFETKSPSATAIQAKGVDNLLIKDNFFNMKKKEGFIKLTDCSNVHPTEDIKDVK